MPKGSIRQACQRAKHGSCGSALFAASGRKMAVRFARFDRCILKAHHAIADRLIKILQLPVALIKKPVENTVK